MADLVCKARFKNRGEKMLLKSPPFLALIDKKNVAEITRPKIDPFFAREKQ